MGNDIVLKEFASVAGIKGGRQVVDFTLQAATRNINGEETSLSLEQIEAIRANAASVAQLSGVEVEVFSTVYNLPPVDLKNGETLRLDKTAALVKTSPVEPPEETEMTSDETSPVIETEVEPVEFV